MSEFDGSFKMAATIILIGLGIAAAALVGLGFFARWLMQGVLS
jgi:hypothetical protein